MNQKDDNCFSQMSQHSGPEDSPGFLLWQVSTLWRREIETVLKTFDLTHPQFVILATTAWLTQTGKKVSQIEIARQAKLDPNTTSQILRSLQTKKLIERKQTTDERSKEPQLTLTGFTILKKALPAVEKKDQEFFSKVDLKNTSLLSALLKLTVE